MKTALFVLHWHGHKDKEGRYLSYSSMICCSLIFPFKGSMFKSDCRKTILFGGETCFRIVFVSYLVYIMSWRWQRGCGLPHSQSSFLWRHTKPVYFQIMCVEMQDAISKNDALTPMQIPFDMFMLYKNGLKIRNNTNKLKYSTQKFVSQKWFNFVDH